MSHKIPVYCGEFEYDEELYEDEIANSFFPCPFSGENILGGEPPEQMLAYFDNLEGRIVHVNPTFQYLYDEFISDEEAYDSRFIEFLIDKLANENQMFLIVVSHPDGVSGDFVELLYLGDNPNANQFL